ncbi:hypothetical protein BpHYR1_019187 [Brachionus plicatilis]|uniref:RNA-directed DNA polymerase from mobile element jockey-like n=1 Tax=Brachionus plicatilis TaxID=10195 RepID=A0A3M7QRA7_BRAPC|nr:hypothetical protein BpHYR1_019187 [Brachionus plicatilis]
MNSSFFRGGNTRTCHKAIERQLIRNCGLRHNYFTNRTAGNWNTLDAVTKSVKNTNIFKKRIDQLRIKIIYLLQEIIFGYSGPSPYSFKLDMFCSFLCKQIYYGCFGFQRKSEPNGLLNRLLKKFQIGNGFAARQDH